MGRTYTDEEAGPARQSYDPASQLGMYRAPNGRRQIPTINTAARGTDVHTDEPGMGVGLPALPVAPRPPSVGLPATAGPADAGNRFGSTNAFQDSVNRSRALRQVRAGMYVDNLTKGQQEQDAAHGAYAQSNLLAGNLALGGAPQQFGLLNDANTRANAESGANVGLTGSQANVNNTLAGNLIPAQAQSELARGEQTRQQTTQGAALLPGQVAAQGIANQAAGGAAPFAGPSAAAGVKQQEAQAAATAQGQGLVKQYQDQIKQQQAYIDHLQSLLVPKATNPTGFNAFVQSAVQQKQSPGLPSTPATPAAPAAAPVPSAAAQPAPGGVAEGTPHPQYPQLKYHAAGPKGPGYYRE